MATTRIIPMHVNKGKTIAQCLKARTDYAKNPDKTDGGVLVSSYACDPETVDAEFLLSKQEYRALTGRTQKRHCVSTPPVLSAGRDYAGGSQSFGTGIGAAFY